MQLLISTTHQPATDLGYLLSKNPEKHQTFELNFGTAHVFYTHASDERCAAALVVDVDPVGLVRGRGDGDGPLTQYVNDRPYAASSFLAVAIAKVYSSALSGSSKSRPELAATAIELQAHLPVLRCRAGESMLRRCFEPLGYSVELQALALDEQFPEWGPSPYFSLTLSGVVRLSDLLAQLYVLLPALDGSKHYYVGSAEVENMLAKGGDWLPSHPQRDWIMSAYLKRQRSLVREALAKLLAAPEEELEQGVAIRDASEHALEQRLSLNEQRMQLVQAELVQSGASSVLDLGCGEGRLLGNLLELRQFTRLLGVDVSCASLERAADRLHLQRLPAMQRARIELQQSSLTYRDEALEGFDAACAIEVIEHIDRSRLAAFERAVFEFAQPSMVIITTPNIEYNVRFERLAQGSFRHTDHRFEWTREEFRQWALAVCQRYPYQVRFEPIGPVDAVVGAPTQMGVFSR